VTEQPPPELLRRLRPIPTYRDHPATTPADLTGVDPEGRPLEIAVVGAAEPVLLLFLSSSCLGCRDLWEGSEELRQALPERIQVVVVTKGPEHEDPAAIAALAPAGIPTLMSSPAWLDYRVGGPPFLVVVLGHEVRTEGVAWGIAETTRATRHALDGQQW
jgi:hypothetical protein